MNNLNILKIKNSEIHNVHSYKAGGGFLFSGLNNIIIL
jgi:hypothetical protein